MDIPVFTGTHADFLIIVSSDILYQWGMFFYSLSLVLNLNGYSYDKGIHCGEPFLI